MGSWHISLDTSDPDAIQHAGADPATLAWVLSESRLAPTAPIPAGITAREIEAFRGELIATFTRMALPEG